jgi:hypothetical protein
MRMHLSAVIQLCRAYCAEWCVSLGRGHDWLTNEILCVLFCSVDLDRVHTNIEEGAHQGYATFGEWRIRINIVPDGTHTIISPLVRTMNSTNQIARYTYAIVSERCVRQMFKYFHLAVFTIILASKSAPSCTDCSTKHCVESVIHAWFTQDIVDLFANHLFSALNWRERTIVVSFQFDRIDAVIFESISIILIVGQETWEPSVM